MPEPESPVDLENAQFAEIALESLREGVRRALLDHQRRGQMVPVWSAGTIKWVAPAESLALHPVPRPGANTPLDTT